MSICPSCGIFVISTGAGVCPSKLMCNFSVSQSAVGTGLEKRSIFYHTNSDVSSQIDENCLYLLVYAAWGRTHMCIDKLEQHLDSLGRYKSNLSRSLSLIMISQDR